MLLGTEHLFLLNEVRERGHLPTLLIVWFSQSSTQSITQKWDDMMNLPRSPTATHTQAQTL